MTRTTLAIAADYADAMLVARRWKNLLFLVLLVLLLIQIGVFLGVRFYGGQAPAAAAAMTSATEPAQPVRDLGPAVAFLTNFVDFFAVLSVAVLWVVLLIVEIIMLVGRLVGVTHVTGALILCAVLGALLFPWQSLWNYPMADTVQIVPNPVEQVGVGPRFGWPGVLYTYPELEHRARFESTPWQAGVVGWARFVLWPLVAILLLLIVQARGSRGLKMALGEAEMEAGAPPPPGV